LRTIVYEHVKQRVIA